MAGDRGQSDPCLFCPGAGCTTAVVCGRLEQLPVAQMIGARVTVDGNKVIAGILGI